MNHRYGTLLAALWLAACGGGGGGQPAPNQPAPPAPSPPANPSLAVSGAVQKGPFLVGSTVLINRLDSLGRSTASTIVSQVEDSIGSFDFVPTDPGPVQIVASGYYFSELTGQISTGTLTLRGLYQITAQPSQTAYVNMLTHLINDRVLALLSGGTATLSSAIAQAEREVLAAFQPALPVTGVDTFSGLTSTTRRAPPLPPSATYTCWLCRRRSTSTRRRGRAVQHCNGRGAHVDFESALPRPGRRWRYRRGGLHRRAHYVRCAASARR